MTFHSSGWVLFSVALALIAPLNYTVRGAQPLANKDAKVERVLARARMAAGLTPSRDLKTFLLSGTRSLATGGSFPFSVKIAFPDRLRVDDVITHVLVGDRFWQKPNRPGRSPSQQAKQNITERGAEVSLIYLLTELGQMKLRSAVVGESSASIDIQFKGAGGFDRTVRFDTSTALPVAFWHRGPLSQNRVTHDVERKVVIEGRNVVSGVSFPWRMKETIGPYTASIVTSEVRMNAAIPDGDFAR